MTGPLRIANCSGFYGDRATAMREMLTGGDLDVVTGDYLAELTMLILARDRLRDPSLGYAKTFLQQAEECLGLAKDKGVALVSNAGGLNPAGLAAALHELSERLGIPMSIAFVEGDDLLARADELGLGSPLAANAYFGAWGIARCLQSGADVVVTGRVTDASLVVGPAAAHFGWGREDYHALAGAVVAGHVIECGAQATGGNYSFFTEIDDLSSPGFPIAEVHADGSSVITKHRNTGGAVTVGTVTAQLLYEVSGARYAGPDVVARLDTVQLSADGDDRVRISGVRGEAPPPELKVSVNQLGGFRNEVQFVLTGLDLEAKAELAQRQFEAGLRRKPSELTWSLARIDQPDAPTEEQSSALLRCVARDSDPKIVGRSFSNVAVQLALSSYPGFHLTSPPAEGQPYGVFQAAYISQQDVEQVAVLADGSREVVAGPTETLPLTGADSPTIPAYVESGPGRRVPLGLLVGARSGDKGGAANVGVWAKSAKSWPWLVHALTVGEFRRLLPETRDLPVTRYVLPNLNAVNFVIDGLLGLGVAYNARFDPQAKAVGEWLRARHVTVPLELLP